VQILTLGKVPKIVYIANGKAYRAQFFHGSDMRNFAGLFARLGIKVIFSNAITRSQKTIEPHWH
jgi:putative transposase